MRSSRKHSFRLLAETQLHSGCPCPVTSELFSLDVTTVSTHTGDNACAHPKHNAFEKTTTWITQAQAFVVAEFPPYWHCWSLLLPSNQINESHMLLSPPLAFLASRDLILVPTTEKVHFLLFSMKSNNLFSVPRFPFSKDFAEEEISGANTTFKWQRVGKARK